MNLSTLNEEINIVGNLKNNIALYFDEHNKTFRIMQDKSTEKAANQQNMIKTKDDYLKIKKRYGVGDDIADYDVGDVEKIKNTDSEFEDALNAMYQDIKKIARKG